MTTGMKQWRCQIKTKGRTSPDFFVQALNSDAASHHMRYHVAPRWLLPDEEIAELIVQEVPDSVVMESLGVRPLFDLGEPSNASR